MHHLLERRVTRRAVAAAMAVTTIAGVGLALSPQAAVGSPATVPTWSAGRPGSTMNHFGGGTLDVATEAPRRRVIALNAWEYDQIPAIKAANPNALVLVYKDMSSTRSYPGAYSGGVDAALLPTGVGYGAANATHPEWFLTDAAGNRLTYSGYADHWQMDVGNPAYQAAWAANVSAEVAAKGWDGVIIDNALTVADSYHSGVVPKKYPSDAAFQGAYRSMLATVGGQLRAAGAFVTANISDAYRFPGLWKDWVGLLDAGNQEHFLNWNNSAGSGYVWDWGATGWKTEVDEIADAASIGKMAMLDVNGAAGDTALYRYALASYLLANDGRSTIAVVGEGYWMPELDWDLGAPLGPYAKTPSGLYKRDFAGGTVVVNATEQTTLSINLGGTYTDATGASMSTLTLGPTRGAVLRNAAATTTGAAGTAGTGSSGATASFAASPVHAAYTVNAFGDVAAAAGPGAGTATWPMPLAKGAALAAGGGGYVVDGWGGLHPFGGAPAIQTPAYWPGWDIARAIAMNPDGTSGYTLDGYGGVHPFGGAAAVNTGIYWPGWDLARGIVMSPSSTKDKPAGYVLDGWGGVHAFGSAPVVMSSAYWPGGDLARGIALNPDGAGGYVLDAWGGLHQFGNARAVFTPAFWFMRDMARGIAVTGTGSGYTLDAWGGLHPFGGAAPLSSPGWWPGQDVARAIAVKA